MPAMSDPLQLLLIAADDDAVLAAVTAAGGFDRAIRLLADAAAQLRSEDAPPADIRAIIAVSDRVEALARRTP
jgi:hypothetical protein